MEEHKNIRTMKYIIKLLYFQGVWVEDTNEESDISRFYSPRMSSLLLRHPGILVFLRLLRNTYPYFMMAISAMQLFVSLPVHMFQQRDTMTAHDAGAVICCMFEATFFITVQRTFLQKEKIKEWFISMMKISRNCFLENKEQFEIFNNGVQWFSHNLPVFLPQLVMVILCVTTSAHVAEAVFLGKRKFYSPGWYPYNATATPAFEITLFVVTLHTILKAFTFAAYISTLLFMFNYEGIYFKILNKKIHGIRDLSMKAVESRSHEKTERIVVDEDFVLAISSGYNKLSDVRHNNLSITPLEGLGLLKPLIKAEHLTLARPKNRKLRPTLSSIRCSSKMRRSLRLRHVKYNAGKTERSIIEDKALQMSDGDVDEEMLRQLRQFIEIHQSLLSSSSNLGCATNGLCAFLHLTTILAAAGTIPMLNSGESGIIHKVLFLVFDVGIVATYYVFCYMLDFVATQSADAINAVYECDWLEASNGFKKTMRIAMTRANCKLESRARGMPPLSLELFGMTMNQAFNMFNTFNQFLNVGREQSE